MFSNISFGSMFNPERVSYSEKLSNPEYNLEGLEGEAERPKDFPAFPDETIGRSQVKQAKGVKLSDEDKKYLSNFNCDKYGFQVDGDNFCVQSKSIGQDGKPNIILKDGKLCGKSKQGFVANLIDDNVKGVIITGENHNGDKETVAFVQDASEKIYRVYYFADSPVEVSGAGFKGMAQDFALEDFQNIHGVTIWK